MDFVSIISTLSLVVLFAIFVLLCKATNNIWKILQFLRFRETLEGRLPDAAKYKGETVRIIGLKYGKVLVIRETDGKQYEDTVDVSNLSFGNR